MFQSLPECQPWWIWKTVIPERRTEKFFTSARNESLGKGINCLETLWDVLYWTLKFAKAPVLKQIKPIDHRLFSGSSAGEGLIILTEKTIARLKKRFNVTSLGFPLARWFPEGTTPYCPSVVAQARQRDEIQSRGWWEGLQLSWQTRFLSSLEFPIIQQRQFSLINKMLEHDGMQIDSSVFL